VLEYTDTGARPRLMLLVHQDDAERGCAYDRDSKVGRLDRALDQAGRRRWTVVCTKNDWKSVFPAGKPTP
jgi:hypothetical protein